MRRIDQVIGGKVFDVDALACSFAATAISQYQPDTEKTPWHNLPLSTQLTFKLAFISVCHDFNWDFMQNTLAKQLLTDNEPSIISTLIDLDAKALRNWLSEYPKQERIRAPERAAFLRDVGKTLQEKFGGDAQQIINASNRRLGGDQGFIFQLDAFEAFRRDPLRKKSNVLVHDLVREKVIRFADEEKIEPAIDYHIMRLYLRTGRVVPTSIEVVEELKGRPQPRRRLVNLLREAVSEALKQTAFYSNLSVPDVNYIEWQLGRAVCMKELPACQKSEHDTALAHDVARLYSGSCPYLDFCQACSDPNWLAMREPDFKSSFY